ncbi:leucine-rich repeat-containing protein 72 [Lingula anatina]|uniref:Leucine-rich repeat-containing protein 72 n=1 Tax=Lingula anatina TaxID=7574 RepID=A0A1S3HGR9_LINAN|nr:leucine-rich repeat-containing protein 72 [Lingula anatina]|eukprot:XP_013384676.1 leucine-rich repeat-containing protein 72 [Lingula anatina]
MADLDQTIKTQLEKQNIKRNVDVKQLYLSKCNLRDVSDLGRFKNLKYLWLNQNMLTSINFLANNYRLSELYLQENHLKEITGALKHLTSMEVLYLHNNQLTKLEKVVAEFRKMQNLKSLNLFSNPVAQEPDYRLFVISSIPSLELLDRQEITKDEKDRAREIYDQEQEEVRGTIAFGRRSQGPPCIYYPSSLEKQAPTNPVEFEIGNNFYRNSPNYTTPDDAVNARLLKKSVMQFSRFDWAKVPRGEQKRTSEEPFETPQVLTMHFR